MAIEKLDISGFRSLKNISWQLSPLTIVIGPNGSGKSNLLRFLEFISVSGKGQLARHIQAQGGTDAILWDGQVESVNFSLLAKTSLRGPFNSNGTARNPPTDLAYTLNLRRFGNSLYVLDYEELGGFEYRHQSIEREFPPYIRGNEISAAIYAMQKKGEAWEEIPIPLDEVNPNETLLSQIAVPLSSQKTLVNFRKDLSDWAIYQNIDVGPDSEIRRAVVTRRETRVDADVQNLVPVLHTLYSEDRDFKRSVNDAMQAAFGEDFEELVFPPAADQRVQMRVRWRSLKREQSTADLSDGTLRFLFLLAVLAAPDPPPLVAIDEPEAGLHPSMLPIIAEYAVEASRRTQIIFTTHSDRFLDAFPADATPTTTVAKWENGETVLQTLDKDALQVWLREYSLGALFRSGELESGAIG